MTEHRYIDIVPLEKDGWFLSRQSKTDRGLACMETKPLRCVPDIDLVAPSREAPAEDKHFSFPPTFRDKDESGKTVCRRCGKRLGAAKTPFCSNCGGQFVEEQDV